MHDRPEHLRQWGNKETGALSHIFMMICFNNENELPRENRQSISSTARSRKLHVFMYWCAHVHARQQLPVNVIRFTQTFFYRSGI
jgi:hypothetical protein